ncbi:MULTISPECIES: YifB family Mg chelatase-like AAA ATPase [unclassified Corynebacterium]|uniref:YifB family Mg chelatase-like AAA ATPase n=1 Tax=unclassified Corynebacterium TaxID=2624378 RepID=UPI002167B58C|nr:MULTISPECIES: YifB family Mg chelatase-like AAA ATPase [unclassified Corynebacterium]MCS4489089.1 YifB family Mg chelatase-like AAA ATPase [Corynebacterium sp. ES2775-CONJ]MCS4490902.1 YifB family Mg chelatase-like AAA ATPase [Corynebacterium sp. ES2715-CONJ3]MCS4531216.1 YifB family Mg chelatase-like AAA ATPase [Corynebacterium sp. ES2730-CONJ]
MLAKTYSVAFDGINSIPVEVEANIGPGLPGTYIVGMASAAVIEAKDRIKTAAHNRNLPWPKTKITVNLLPGDISKTGNHFDAAIATAILVAQSGDTDLHRRAARTLIVGEIGLDGRLRGVRGTLPGILCAHRNKIPTAIIPHANIEEAQVAAGIGVEIRAAKTVGDIVAWLRGDIVLPTVSSCPNPQTPPQGVVDMNQIMDQSVAKEAAEIAAAGGHSLFLTGPRGSGKSMIAERIPTILPPLNQAEAIETAAIYARAGQRMSHEAYRAPFVAPHHSVSAAALIGGGHGHPKPGAASLAHHGVLFLDEVSEIPARVLDHLRVPLEQGCVRLQRRHRIIELPAQFLLIMAANLCRCAAHEVSECTCSATTRAKYLANISGPLRDRIDIYAKTHSRGTVTPATTVESSANIAQRVSQARSRARYRWEKAGFGPMINATLEPAVVRRNHPADDEAMAMMSSFLARGLITQRGVDRILKIAWTLADLEGAPQPGVDHIARASKLRGSERSYANI